MEARSSQAKAMKLQGCRIPRVFRVALMAIAKRTHGNAYKKEAITLPEQGANTKEAITLPKERPNTMEGRR
jgi:hypothetical protein